MKLASQERSMEEKIVTWTVAVIVAAFVALIVYDCTMDLIDGDTIRRTAEAGIVVVALGVTTTFLGLKPRYRFDCDEGRGIAVLDESLNSVLKANSQARRLFEEFLVRHKLLERQPVRFIEQLDLAHVILLWKK